MPKTEARRDPYSAFNFLLEIDGVVVASFSECSGLIDETGPIDHRTGATDESGTRVPGRRKPPMVVLKRGVTANRALWEWRRGVIEGRLQGHTGAIIVLNEAREPVRRFKFSNGWPSKFEGPDFKAESNEVAIETLEISHEGLVLD